MLFLNTTILDNQGIISTLAAAAICALSAALMVHLLDRATAKAGRERMWWLCGAALATGLGVWTTHFIAMLGYRTDIILGYAHGITLASALIAVLAVGVPFALSALPARRWARILLGAVAGIGIGVMHVTGMAALEGCSQIQSLPANVAACLIGGLFLGLLRGLPPLRYPYSYLIACPLIVIAVCGAHFVSIAGTTVEGQVASVHLPKIQLVLSLLTAGGATILMAGAFIALVATRRFEAQEAAHLRVLATALQNMSNGILKVSSEGIIQLYNTRLCTMLDLAPRDISMGMRLQDFLTTTGRINGWDVDRIARVIANHRIWMSRSTETRVEHHFDNGRILSISCQPVEDGAVLTYDDVTRDRRAQEEISHLAFHDPLTGLSNRRALSERMKADQIHCRASTLMLIDLDRFKSVNDTFGHAVGDQLLKAVADRLRSLDVAGMIARHGGDELAILLSCETAWGEDLPERIVAGVEIPYTLNGLTIVIGCSIGICDSRDSSGPDDLMQRADIALYEAKRRGRGQAVRYRPGMIEAIAERGHLENDLRHALALSQFHIVYQPIMSLPSDRVVSFEALIRWTHPHRGAVSPTEFIPLAEENGLIVQIGKWVLEQACLEAASWPDEQHLAVNVSAVQLRSPLLLIHVADALARSGLAPHRLELELTETALVEDGHQIAHTLNALRQLGIRIAMDDFGTGYSSFAHLRDLPLDRIKIDRSFVAAALSDKNSLAVVKAVIQMGRDMNIPTLAEGVENADQLDLLRKIGCDAVQGYLIGRPALPAEKKITTQSGLAA
ncbi:bifunctional diguanylate cyclase/phosphodiesterase [Methylobacterium adhaesivum]|uniref:EAL domain-containing protein n=1 Tax=Methylobacterium adhaesivum TaxID=333297 RepID=A0ABT8BHG9_9HYPH|nr:EAL domain-containing protein [Methylobacterium adhaesivum]MDN3591574.1 EAL domain-containing protein [Methylobacterium adhaesivum]